MSGELAKPARMSLSAALNTPKFQATIHSTLNDAAKEKRFVASVVSACAANQMLQLCTPESILSSALLGESLKLSPSPQLGQYYMVPYDETAKDANGHAIPIIGADGKQVIQNGYKQWQKIKRAQFQLGYKGYIQLALRSGYYKHLNVISVKQGELKKWNPLTEEIDLVLIDDENTRDEAPTIGYFAMFEYLNGFTKSMYWSREKMERHALRYSKGYAAKKGYTFWEKDFDAMAYKTMLRQLISKWGIMTVDLQTAFESDVVAEQDEYGNLTVKDDLNTPVEDPGFYDARNVDFSTYEENGEAQREEGFEKKQRTKKTDKSSASSETLPTMKVDESTGEVTMGDL